MTKDICDVGAVNMRNSSLETRGFLTKPGPNEITNSNQLSCTIGEFGSRDLLGNG